MPRLWQSNLSLRAQCDYLVDRLGVRLQIVTGRRLTCVAGGRNPPADVNTFGIFNLETRTQGLATHPGIPTKSWNKVTKAARLGGRLFHDLRRSAVRNLVDEEIVDPAAIAISS